MTEISDLHHQIHQKPTCPNPHHNKVSQMCPQQYLDHNCIIDQKIKDLAQRTDTIESHLKDLKDRGQGTNELEDLLWEC